MLANPKLPKVIETMELSLILQPLVGASMLNISASFCIGLRRTETSDVRLTK